MIHTIDWVNGKLKIIDQTKLPKKCEYLICKDTRTVWKAIKALKVRGAPAIGIAGAFGAVVGSRSILSQNPAIFKDRMIRIIKYLASSRPTAVNLFWALERIQNRIEASLDLGVKRLKEVILEEALLILNEDKEICRKIGFYGSKLINDGDSCMTICNAGALATADYGTALGVFYRAKEEGRKFKVYSCETRPLLQGMRLTCWELKQNRIDVTAIADNTAASLMQAGKIDKVFVGADRIAANGDTANKIGTLNLAIVSFYHKVPFYVAAPFSSFDLKISDKKKIPIEHRKGSEVLSLYTVKAANSIPAYNPAFDVTDNKFISAFITERGLIYPPFNQP